MQRKPRARAGWRGLVADLRRAESPRARERLGRFVIEGLRLHERALRAGAGLEAVVLSTSFSREAAPRSAALRAALANAGCRLEIAPDAVLDELTGGRSEPLVGLVRTPPPPALAGVRPSPQGATRILAGIEVEDPGNVGALVRTALAGGASAFAAVGITDPFHPRAARTSMGSLFRLPILRYDALAPLIADLEREGFTTVAAVSEGGTPLPELAPGSSRVAVLLGSEAFGLSPAAQAAARFRTTVPMADAVDSYSVNAVAAVILYELARRERR